MNPGFCGQFSDSVAVIVWTPGQLEKKKSTPVQGIVHEVCPLGWWIFFIVGVEDDKISVWRPRSVK